MINIINLGFKPRSCCWVHRRGQAQGILAVADSTSGVIRLYDGRGANTPLETVENLHRFPVHVMTVRAFSAFPELPTDALISTATDMTLSSRRMKAALLNIGSRLNHSLYPRTSRGCGRSKVRQTCMNLKRLLLSQPTAHPSHNHPV